MFYAVIAEYCIYIALMLGTFLSLLRGKEPNNVFYKRTTLGQGAPLDRPSMAWTANHFRIGS